MITIKDLKEAIKDLPDDMPVGSFDGQDGHYFVDYVEVRKVGFEKYSGGIFLCDSPSNLPKMPVFVVN